MKKCPKCGKPLDDSAFFCDVCGTNANASKDLGRRIEEFINSYTQSGFPEPEVMNGRIIAVLGYIFNIIFFVPLLMEPRTEYGRFHANQQLVLLIIGAISSFVGFIPIIGAIVGAVVSLYSLAMMILGILSALSGTRTRLPLIDKITIIK